MNLRISALCLLLVLSFCAHANPPWQGPYRSAANPHYWKNKSHLLGKDYWQQDVSYRMKARMDEQSDILTGEARITYYNNAPDTLRELFFHLYQNAFQPDSYLDHLYDANHASPRYGFYERQKLGTSVDTLLVNGKQVKTQLDNTILKVWLNTPLLPGDSIQIDVRFETWFDPMGSGRRRMKTFQTFGQKHFDGVHWYPRLAVYDRKKGWDTDQHLGREFYGDFGTFDLELDMASNMVVEATGLLLNRDEVLPDSLRQKLDLRQFAKKPWDSPPSTPIPYKPGERKVWHYRAVGVHDVAFTADPTYRIAEAWVGPIQVVALAQESHASGWQNAADYAAKVISVYQQDIGPYLYNKMVVADARDGMEYPMLTLDGGRDPDYRGLLAHEIAHNWFFGMVGSNETYRAFLDEGFTQFLTTWCLERLEGKYLPASTPSGRYLKKVQRPEEIRFARSYGAYLQSAQREDPVTINTHSDGFDGALDHGGGYRMAYYKTTTMLYNLQMVLGDSLFQRAFRNYFSTWQLAHPYPEDFRSSIIRCTKVDLNWFFDQWIETAKIIDYRVGRPSRLGKGKYSIPLTRNGRGQSSLDVQVETKDGERLNYHIPNDWFIKSTTARIAPKWFGWDLLNPAYRLEVEAPAGIRSVTIDTSGRLADVYRYDNRYPRPVSVKWDPLVSRPNDWRNLLVQHRPDVWFNQVDGIKLGWHAEMAYAQYRHLLEVSAWVNTGLLAQNALPNVRGWDRFNYQMRWREPIHRLSRLTQFELRSAILEGLSLQQVGINQQGRGQKWTYSFFYRALHRYTTEGYTAYAPNWGQALNQSLNVMAKGSSGHGPGQISWVFGLRSGLVGQSPMAIGYQQAHAEARQERPFLRGFLRWRAFAQWSMGAVPFESALFAAGANPETAWDYALLRSPVAAPASWAAPSGNALPGHLQLGGGLNLRGYTGYALPVFLKSRPNEQIWLNTVSNGVSTSWEWGLPGFWPSPRTSVGRWLGCQPYAFADAGVPMPGGVQLRDLEGLVRADAGLGMALQLRHWGGLNRVKPFTLRIDFPVYLSNAPDRQPQNLAFRWQVGINRSF